jgi:hypothetical protein
MNKPPMPPQPTTKPMQRVEVGTDTLNTILLKLNSVDSKLNSVVDSVIELQSWKKSQEERANKQSESAKQLSKADLGHEAAIASIIQKQDQMQQVLNTNTDMTQQVMSMVTSVYNNPLFKNFIIAVIAFTTAWLVRHT